MVSRNLPASYRLRSSRIHLIHQIYWNLEEKCMELQWTDQTINGLTKPPWFPAQTQPAAPAGHLHPAAFLSLFLFLKFSLPPHFHSFVTNVSQIQGSGHRLDSSSSFVTNPSQFLDSGLQLDSFTLWICAFFQLLILIGFLNLQPTY